jgi:hypothetical protein
MPKTASINQNDLATILAALLCFQEQYENEDADVIFADFENQFTTLDGGHLAPLSTKDIDTLRGNLLAVQSITVTPDFELSEDEGDGDV